MEAFAIARNILAEPLAALHNLINQTGDVPKCFRTARVKMLYKKGEKSDMLNYSPIMLVWERLINDKLISHLESNKLSEAQQQRKPIPKSRLGFK